MIASLRGKVAEITADGVVVEVGGVGYDVVLTGPDHEVLRADEEVHFYIYEAIREDAYNLYGFSNKPTKQFFIQLLSISGIGPKVAMNVLSAASLPQLQQAIASGDPELLRGVAGIGKKTAERIVVELRGKVAVLPGEGLAAASSQDPLYQALISLGYTASQAAEVAAKIPASITGDSARLKAALKELT